MTKRWFLARLLTAGTAAAAMSLGLVLPAYAADEAPETPPVDPGPKVVKLDAFRKK